MIPKNNCITFRDYMAWNNEHYYASNIERPNIKRLGKEGDFYTSPLVHPAFGGALARQINQCWEIMEKPSTFTILEFGAGNGKLASHILDALKNSHPQCFQSTSYVISDYFQSSDCLNSSIYPQSLTIGNYKLENLGPFKSTFLPYHFRGVVIANEFLDALPVHRIVNKEDGLKETMICLNKIETELEMKNSTPLINDYFYKIGLLPPISCQGEVNLDAISWLKWISENMEQGYVIVIDYGDLAMNLFTKEKCNGTIRGFTRHQMTSCLYEKPGEQDLTADVNFTALVEFGKDLGLVTLGLTYQVYFLLGLSILSITSPNELITIKRLILPEGMGGSYKVLIQHKGCSPKTLAGLSLRTIPVSN